MVVAPVSTRASTSLEFLAPQVSNLNLYGEGSHFSLIISPFLRRQEPRTPVVGPSRSLDPCLPQGWYTGREKLRKGLS